MQEYYGTKLIHAEPQEQKGGYKVIYSMGTEDQHESWSPKAVFEAAYHPTNAMLFGHAIEALKAGKMVQRAGWNGKGMYLELQVPDANSKMQRPYIFINPGPGYMVPWVASQADMLADDWSIVE